MGGGEPKQKKRKENNEFKFRNKTLQRLQP